MNAKEAQGDGDVLRADFLSDEIEHLQGDGLGPVNLRASRRSKSQLNLAGVYLWKDFGAQTWSGQAYYRCGQDQVNGDHNPPCSNQSLGQSSVTLLEPRE